MERDLIDIQTVEVVLFIAVEVCPTQGCARRRETFYATRSLCSCEEATIRFCIRAVLTLVSSTLRDTSFIYYIWYSLNSPDRSPLLRSPLDAMDEIDEPAIRVPLRLLFDFVIDRVITYIIRKHRSS
jgi:hypothetical protein